MSEFENKLISLQDFIDIQDYIVPKLDMYEQAIYHYLIRHTLLINKHETYFSCKSAPIGFGTGNNSSPPSEASRRKKLSSLDTKGFVEIISSSHLGILVKVKLPKEIPNLIPSNSKVELDLETVNFYSNKFKKIFLERENFKCFYLGKEINENNCYLDHVISQSNKGNNSYRNIVASSFDANSLKNDKKVEDFIREIYRKNFISLEEFEQLKAKLELLKQGKLKPNEDMVLELLEN